MYTTYQAACYSFFAVISLALRDILPAQRKRKLQFFRLVLISPLHKGRSLLEKLTNGTLAQLYVTKLSTVSLYLTKLYVTQRFTIASLVTYREIRQHFSNSVQNSTMIPRRLRIIVRDAAVTNPGPLSQQSGALPVSNSICTLDHVFSCLSVCLQNGAYCRHQTVSIGIHA